MNKKDIPILIVLVALWVAWPHIYQRYFKKAQPEQEGAEQVVHVVPEGEQAAPAPVVEAAKPAAPEPVVEPALAAPVPEPEPAPSVPERTAMLADDQVEITLSSRGGTVTRAVLKDYPDTMEEDSGPVVLNFASFPALAYQHVAGLTPGNDFEFEVQEDFRQVQFEHTTPGGLRLRRTIRLEGNYVLKVSDELLNTGAQAVTLPKYEVAVGPMESLAKHKPSRRTMVFLGADTLLQGGKGVKHWANKIPGWFKNEEGLKVSRPLGMASDWVAVKNKFFVQILTPEDGLDDCIIHAVRAPEANTTREVSASLVFPTLTLVPNEPFVRDYHYYIGPKKVAVLKQFGLHQTEVMELGWFAPIGKFLLVVMNFIHDHLWPHNYGLAVMLLTIIIRVMFWPLTHKGTESMKRMQELQPLMKEIREKHKDNSQKQQQAMMALYKEHKVNPMMGCLPMVIQIPVFIGLFYVLRSAIELRYADFLWVQDLSEPERLLEFGFTIPVLGWDALNVLPFIMTATTFLQQKLTPSTGDSSQQKMMMFMPVMMLFFLYNFASGLVLYWTTNNCLMIAQQLLQRRQAKAKRAAEESDER